MSETSFIPLFAVLVSALASLLILFSGKQPNLREFWTFAAAFLKFSLVLSLYPAVSSGITVTTPLFEIVPGITSAFRVDALGLTFALLSSGLWIITSLYNVGYMRTLKEHEQTRYYFSFALSLSAAIGIAFSADLVTFFIFYEILTLATYPLVAHKENREAVLAGRKYLVYALTAGVALLFAIGWTFHATGEIAFRAGGFLKGNDFSHAGLVLLFFLFIYGCGVKGALFPVHAWLPTAMVAPTPVSALLHAVAVVKAGIFGILRVTGYVFGPSLMENLHLAQPLAWIAAFTVLAASCIALVQDNLKRRLAYSTISQLAYIILGAALAAPSAFTGSILHLVNHGIMKITLFFCAGVIYAKSHIENISDMHGIGRKMPWTLTAFAVASLGLAGLPPFNGFVSKWFLAKGALEAESWIFFSVYMLSALLNLAYFVPVVYTAFLPPKSKASVSENPVPLIAPPVITGILVILFGIIPWLFHRQIELAKIAANGIFGA